jgi:hypothetical protein
MMGGLVGAGASGILRLRPRFYWDAVRAQQAVGPAKAGGPMLAEVYETASGASTAKWLIMNDFKQWQFMTDGIDTAAGKDRCLGSVGAFYMNTSANYHVGYTTAKYNYAVVAPTAAGQLSEDGADFPNIARNPDIATSRRRVYLDSSLDAVNACVVEKSQSRSASWLRQFQVLVRGPEGVGDPTGIVTLGWNATAGTRLTSTPVYRPLWNDNWWAISILVPANASTAGYGSIAVKADSGKWEFAFPGFWNQYTGSERITRAGFGADVRLEYAVRTTVAEICLRPSGWLAMSVVLPDRSTDHGHTDNAGNANYKFLGMLNLDCDTWRLRVSMSDTYDRVVVNLGDTSGTNFAFLDGPSSWDDFEPLGIVATWEEVNKNTQATLWVNGERLDSSFNPATWYPQTPTPGTLIIGNSATDGTPGECMISRVAYGTNRLNRSTARALSARMRDLARGGNYL